MTDRSEVSSLSPSSNDDQTVRQAADLFSHGVLSVIHESGTEARERRVSRVMTSLADSTRRERDERSRHPRGRRLRRLFGAGTVLSAIVAAAVLIITPERNTTYATIQDAVAAMREPGDRRYEVSVEFADMPTRASEPESGDAPSLPTLDAPYRKQTTPHAIIDTRHPSLTLIQIITPDGGTLFIGRDDRGEWAIPARGERAGDIIRDSPRRVWPHWATVDGESIFDESLDQWLEAAARVYHLRLRENAIPPGRDSGPTCTHVVGDRKPAIPRIGPRPTPGPAADRIELWIDPKTKHLVRMELEWNPRPPMEIPGSRVRPGPGGEGTPMTRSPRGPGHGPRPAFGPGPEPAPAPGADPMGNPKARSDSGGPDGMPDEPRDGPRRPPPLRRMVIDQVAPPDFAPDWFTPESHAGLR